MGKQSKGRSKAKTTSKSSSRRERRLNARDKKDAMSKADVKFMRDHGEAHPLHTLGEIETPSHVKRLKLDFTQDDRPYRRRFGQEEEQQPVEPAAEDSESEIEDSADKAYSELLQSIKPRGRFAQVLQQRLHEDEDEEEDDAVGSDEEAAEDDENEDNLDDDLDDGEAEEIEVELTPEEFAARRAELGDEFELVPAEEDGDEDGEDGEDGEEALDSEDEDALADAEADDLAAVDAESEEDEAGDDSGQVDAAKAAKKAELKTARALEIEQELKREKEDVDGNARNKLLREHFDFDASTDENADLLRSMISSQLTNKSNRPATTTTDSPNFGTAKLTDGYAPFTQHMDSVPVKAKSAALKPRLRWWALHDKKASKPDPLPKFLDLPADTTELLMAMDTYKDVYLPQWSFESAPNLRNAYALHILNHVLKMRTITLKNTERLKKAAAQNKEIDVRDFGFTKPRVLVLQPYRFCAMRLVETMINLLVEPEDNSGKRRGVANRTRFVAQHHLLLLLCSRHHCPDLIKSLALTTRQPRSTTTRTLTNSLTAMWTTTLSLA